MAQHKKPRLVLKGSILEEDPEPGSDALSLRRQGLSFASIAQQQGEFPSLGNTGPMSNASQVSMWSAAAGSRNLPGQIGRNQAAPLLAQPAQADELYTPTPSRLMSTQAGAFRFGSSQPASQGQPSGPAGQTGSSVDDFPPLNKNVNGEIGQERAGIMSLGFGSQGGGGVSSGRAGVGNGLLNAVSASTRPGETRTRSSMGGSSSGGGGMGASRAQESRQSIDDDSRQKQQQQHPTGFREDTPSVLSSGPDHAGHLPEGRNPHGAIGAGGAVGAAGHDAGKSREEKEGRTHEVVDPLAGMSETDKWGLKGLRTLMHNYPDYNAMIVGVDPNTLGLDLGTNDIISTQHWSVFDEEAPRPVVDKFRLPDCYKVTNVAPIETKMPSFNEETLFWIFYSCTRDIKQHMAAAELHTRNWRWHKKHHMWLTKDEHVTPQTIGHNVERGCYIIWDTKSWRKDRREMTLNYADLDTSLSQP